MNYITLLASDDYLDGVLVLYKSLRVTKCKYPFIAAITSTLNSHTLEVLKNLDIETVLVDKLECENVPPKNKWRLTYTKLHLFGLVQFSKLVYLDADMVVLENLDHLFDKPHMSAVSAGSWSCVKTEKYSLNSGLLVIVPNIKDYTALIRIATSRNKFLGDQDIINAHFFEWYKNYHLHLDLKYNVFVNQISYVRGKYYLENYNDDESYLPKVGILHYVRPKPWDSKDIHLISDEVMFLYNMWHDIKKA